MTVSQSPDDTEVKPTADVLAVKMKHTPHTYGLTSNNIRI